MPWKWKIFRVIRYLLLLFTVGMLVFIAYAFIASWQPDEWDASTMLIFFLVIWGMVMLNCDNNVILIEKYYPARPIPENWKVYAGVIYFFSCVIIGFLSLAFIINIHELTTKKSSNPGTTFYNHAFQIISATFLLLCYYAFWMQVALRKTISRNAAVELEDFLRD